MGADGNALDADGDDFGGGDSASVFRTLPLTLIPGTIVEGVVRGLADARANPRSHDFAGGVSRHSRDHRLVGRFCAGNSRRRWRWSRRRITCARFLCLH